MGHCLLFRRILFLSESGVPQLVQPMIWDYAADLDVESKGLYSAELLRRRVLLLDY